MHDGRGIAPSPVVNYAPEPQTSLEPLSRVDREHHATIRLCARVVTACPGNDLTLGLFPVSDRPELLRRQVEARDHDFANRLSTPTRELEIVLHRARRIGKSLDRHQRSE